MYSGANREGNGGLKKIIKKNLYNKAIWKTMRLSPRMYTWVVASARKKKKKSGWYFWYNLFATGGSKS